MQKLVKMMMSVLAAGQIVMLGGCASKGSDDQIGPYINLTTYEFHTTIGSPVDFSNVSGYDDVDGMVQVYVIDDANYDVPGVYYPVLTARDMTGNVTEVPVTVVVEEVSYVENAEADSLVNQTMKKQGCDDPNALNPNEACEAVVDPNVSRYITLYASETSKTRCEKEAIRINGSCEVILSNDGSLWGYGLSEKPKVLETAEPEKKDEEKESE